MGTLGPIPIRGLVGSIERRPSMSRLPFQLHDDHRQFNNADSFAAAFDEAWTILARDPEAQNLTTTEKLGRILDQISDHPFALTNAARAREVGEFRLRLLGL
jgi:hypothetical protein